MSDHSYSLHNGYNHEEQTTHNRSYLSFDMLTSPASLCPWRKERSLP
jgi:hypothetical protein